MRTPIRQKDLDSPDKILSQLLRDYIDGKLGGDRVLYRAVVLEIDHVGGNLVAPTTSREEPPNPRGSIVARVISEAYDIHTPEEELPVLWPMFPFDTMPIKEGEHVYVMFEDEEQRHGLWVTRIAEPNTVDSLNYVPGTKKYAQDSDNEISENTGAAEQAVQEIDNDPGLTNPEDNFTVEDVPFFTARSGDRVINGSNNTAIILSRDRISDSASGQSDGAGSIDIVAGRTGEDIDLGSDASTIYISQKTNPDDNFNIDAGDAIGDTPAIIVKSDEIRIIARNNLKVIVESGPSSVVIDKDGNIKIEHSGELEIKSKGGKATLESDKIVLDGNVEVGGSGGEPTVKGDALKQFLKTVLSDILASAPVDVVGIPGLGVINSNVKQAVDAAMDTALIKGGVLSANNTTD